jgi:diadenosine tetraphosphate (Ap4A) HIT family hydrolase
LCQLVDGLVERTAVFEDEVCVALMTIEPVNAGHTMVVPRQHIALLGELDDATWLHVCAVAKRVDAAMRAPGLRCEATNMFLADGEAAFHEIPHLHLPVFPRFAGDAFRIQADLSASPSRAELDRAASLIAGSM